MRYLYTILLLTTFGLCQANDALTRAEIYNYNVGDTFDYHIYNADSYLNHPEANDTNDYYERYVIRDIVWASDSLTKTIYSEKIFPLPSQNDTTVIDSITNYQVEYNDSSFCIYPSSTPEVLTNQSTPFMGRQTNYYKYNPCGPGYIEYLYAQGLGIAIRHQVGSALSNNYNYTTTLIYYSNATEHLGTPYTEQPTAIHEQEKSVFKVYPTLVTNEFWIEMEQPSEQSNVLIYNLQGQQLLQQQLQGNKTKIDIHNLPSGVYVWKVFTGNNFKGAGKVLKEN